MPGISLSDFFNSKRKTSEIKTEFLNEYFKAWAAIMLRGQNYKNIHKLLYVDLFSGPGIYDDGKESTPIKILNSIYASKGEFVDYDKYVQTIFNDKDQKLYKKLITNIENLPYYEELTYKPIISNGEASIELLEEVLKERIPSLTFIDPLGYGFTQKMLMYTIKKWGSDLFMLFNFNRIRAAIANSKVEINMLEIFGEKFQDLQNYYDKEYSPQKREKFIIQTFESIFEERGYMVLKFKINFPDKEQTSHYLFFISKVALAITRAKEILSKYSDYQEDGIPQFGSNLNIQPVLDPDMNEYSINKLADSILEDVSLNNQTLDEIYKIHNYKTNYIKGNYKQAIKVLLSKKLVELFDKKGKSTKRVTYTAKIKFK